MTAAILKNEIVKLNNALNDKEGVGYKADCLVKDISVWNKRTGEEISDFKKLSEKGINAISDVVLVKSDKFAAGGGDCGRGGAGDDEGVKLSGKSRGAQSRD